MKWSVWPYVYVLSFFGPVIPMTLHAGLYFYVCFFTLLVSLNSCYTLFQLSGSSPQRSRGKHYFYAPVSKSWDCLKWILCVFCCVWSVNLRLDAGSDLCVQEVVWVHNKASVQIRPEGVVCYIKLNDSLYGISLVRWEPWPVSACLVQVHSSFESKG